MGTPEMIATTRLVPYHEAVDPFTVAALANAMTARGWDGPPLVGWRDTEVPDGYDERMVWLATGSGHVAAADHIRLEEIPVLVTELAYEELVSSGAARDGHIGLTDVSAFRELIQTRWPDAATLIASEGNQHRKRSNDDSGSNPTTKSEP